MLVLVACHSVADRDSGDAGGLVGDCDLVLPAACDDAPLLGESDATVTDVVDVDLAWSTRCLSAVAEPVVFRVPDDIHAIHLTVDAGPIPSALEVAVDGRPLLLRADDDELPFRFSPRPGASLGLPISPDTRPQPGCWAVAPHALDIESDATTALLYVTTRRGDAPRSRLPIVAVRVDEPAITAEAIADVVRLAGAPLTARSGIELDLIDIVDVSFDGAPIGFSSGRFEVLAAVDAGGGVPVLFVDRFTEAYIAGGAAGIPGAVVPGTSSSGVMVAVDLFTDASGAVDVDTLARVTRHELGHHLGLFHPTEASLYVHDPLPDTPECTAADDVDGDGRVSWDECPTGTNVMYWQAAEVDQNDLTDDQVAVLLSSTALTP